MPNAETKRGAGRTAGKRARHRRRPLVARGWQTAVAGTLLAAMASAEEAQRGALDYQSQPEAPTGRQSPKVVWQYQAAGPVRNAVELHRGLVYVSSADGVLHALDADTGLPLWTRELGAAIGAPVARHRLLVVIDRRNRVHAVDALTGDVVWTTETGADVDLKWGLEGWDYLIPAPAMSGDVIFAGSGDGALYALRAEDGTVLWRHQTNGRIRAAPAVDGDVVYIGSGDGYFRALDTGAGRALWRFKTAGVKLDGAEFGYDRTQIMGAATVTEDAVYFGSRDARLYALDRRRGSALWRFEEPSAWVIAAPAVAGDTLYSTRSSSANVRAVNRSTGEELWQRRLDGPIFASPVIVGDRLYVATGEGTLYAFDRATGNEAWSIKAGGRLWGTPLAHDRRLYFGGDNGTVYALTDHERSSPALAVFWDEDLLRFSSQARNAATARELLTGLVARGYQVLNRDALPAFLKEGTEDRRRVIVFAMDSVPAADLEQDAILADFLQSGGGVVWLGRPPGVIVRDAQGAFVRIDTGVPGRLLDVAFDEWNTDRYPSWSTAAGKRRGLPAFWTASPTIGGDLADVEVLASDEFERPVAWSRRYGEAAGGGFTYLGDLWDHAGACTIASVAQYGVMRGGYAAGALPCDTAE
jgi:eukaryotic-like serine/threonine-protein kinase